MDPLTALGLASNIIQFVDFTTKLISTTRKLYNSSSGARDEYLELELLARNIRESAGRADHDVVLHSKDSAEAGVLVGLSRQCIEVSNQLLSVLSNVRVQGQHRGWTSFYQALRSEWKKEDIEALQQRLDRISNQLNIRTLLDKQDEVVSKLHILTVQNRRLEASRTEDIEDLRQGFKQIFEEIQEEGSENRAALKQLSLATEKGLGYASEQILLESIRFDTVEDRQSAVREAHHKTFSWIFEGSTASESSGNFAEWLASDDSFFWVSGKPGSGKSTLMKFLCEHQETRRILETWATAQGQQLVIANFFFWNAGRQALQKSQEGLLRSILYQILRQCPDLIPFAAPSLSGPLGGPVKRLTVAKLLDAFRDISAQMATSKINFCFFLDGLDEYEGKPNDIIQLVEVLKSMLKVKLCVSSRPWNEFEKDFGQDKSKKLYMHDLTRGDIELYVRDILENDAGFRELQEHDSSCLDLVQDVVDAAKGVFLWVFLVVRSLLEATPTDLNEYFERILFTVDNFYRTQTTQMFQVTLAAYETLPSLCYWYIDQEDHSLVETLEVASLSQKETEHRLKQTQKRLNACCKGLLEVTSTAGDHFLKVDFLHRTVRDFLRIPEMQKLLDKWTSEDFNEHIAICESIVSVIKTTPQEEPYFQSYGPIINLLTTLLYHIEIQEIDQSLLTTEVLILDELDKTLKKHSDAVDGAASTLYAQHWGGPLSTGDISVLNIAAQKGFCRYLQVKVDEKHCSASERSDLLLAALISSGSRPETTSRFGTVSLLLEQGFDPNLAIQGGRSTVWTYFLEKDRSRQPDTYDLIKALLMHGADVSSEVDGKSAADAVRELLWEDEARELAPLLPWVQPKPKAFNALSSESDPKFSLQPNGRVQDIRIQVSHDSEDDYSRFLWQEAMKLSGQHDEYGNGAARLKKPPASDDRTKLATSKKQMSSQVQGNEVLGSRRRRFVKSLFGRKHGE